MGKYLLKRTFNYLVMLFIAVTLAYFLCAAFLDPRLLYPIENPDFNWQALNQSLDAKNLNPSEPILSRYWDWLSGVSAGTGVRSRRPVSSTRRSRTASGSASGWSPAAS